jgi:Sulfotransferase family
VSVVKRADPPFFVVGNPRSGTKMLRELLNSSPDVWISDIESHFIPEVTRTIERYGDLGRRDDFTRLAEALGRTRAFWYWSRRGIQIDPERWYARCRSHDWPGVLEGLFHCVHEQEIPDPPTPWEQILWGDKTPVYMVDIPLLARLFPQARFVHILRDPRDCCLSAEKTWGDSPIRGAQRWADRTRICRMTGRELGLERYHEVRYEDLVGDVSVTLGAVFAFLGVATPPDAGRLLRVPENYGAARGDGRILSANTQKWRTQMPPVLRRRIEELTGDLLDELGYEREHPGLPLRRLADAQMTIYRLGDAWRQLRFRRRELGGWVAGVRFLLAR